jgi:hypothetical protein
VQGTAQLRTLCNNIRAVLVLTPVGNGVIEGGDDILPEDFDRAVLAREQLTNDVPNRYPTKHEVIVVQSLALRLGAPKQKHMYKSSGTQSAAIPGPTTRVPSSRLQIPTAPLESSSQT